jgi:hypothetical protein
MLFYDEGNREKKNFYTKYGLKVVEDVSFSNHMLSQHSGFCLLVYNRYSNE